MDWIIVHYLSTTLEKKLFDWIIGQQRPEAIDILAQADRDPLFLFITFSLALIELIVLMY